MLPRLQAEELQAQINALLYVQGYQMSERDREKFMTRLGDDVDGIEPNETRRKAPKVTPAFLARLTAAARGSASKGKR